MGCAEQPGQGIILDSVFAATAGGLQAAGHELGHNLGLAHCQDDPGSCPAVQPGGDYLDLMNASVNGSTVLTATQRVTILNSGLIQRSSAGLFINLQPIVFGTPPTVPEPAALSLFVSGLALMIFVRRRRIPSAGLPGK